MPKGFNDCKKNGGKIVTKKLSNGKYMHICYDKKGKAHPGEVKKTSSTVELVEELKDLCRKWT